MIWADLLDVDGAEQCAKRPVITNELGEADKASAAREQVRNTLRFARRAMTVEEMSDACAIGLRHAQEHLDGLLSDGLVVCHGGFYSLVVKSGARRR